MPLSDAVIGAMPNADPRPKFRYMYSARSTQRSVTAQSTPAPSAYPTCTELVDAAKFLHVVVEGAWARRLLRTQQLRLEAVANELSGEGVDSLCVGARA